MEQRADRSRRDRAASAQESVDWLGVPLQSEGRTLGALVVQSYREETAHTEADKELLTFVGHHIASALERTRLIDETRQRNAELALINDVQRGLAMNLDMQAMYDLVGDRLQEIFDAQVVDIGVLDEAAGIDPLPVHDRARRAVPRRADPGHRLPPARARDAGAAPRSTRIARSARPSSAKPAAIQGEPREVVAVRPARRRRAGRPA